jgi:hypothetical protein
LTSASCCDWTSLPPAGERRPSRWFFFSFFKIGSPKLFCYLFFLGFFRFVLQIFFVTYFF